VLERVFENQGKILPNLVQTFYANLSSDDASVIHSRVGSIDVTLSVTDITHILALCNEEFNIFFEHLNSFQLYPEGESCKSTSLLIHNNSNPALTLNDKVSYLTIHVRY